LSSFDLGTFEEGATVAYALMGVILELKLNQKGGFTILLALMLLIRYHVTPRNIQEVQVSKLGDSPRHPFFIDKNQVIF
jgi:hypothetical protein